jgi:hypothetical protein
MAPAASGGPEESELGRKNSRHHPADTAHYAPGHQPVKMNMDF